MKRASRVSLIAVALAAATAAPAFAERVFEYIHVDADSGAASGGHAAIRFGDLVYHFQHHDNDVIRLSRDPFAAFDHTYRGLGNRSLHVRSIAVSSDTFERLQSAFEHRYLVENSQLAHLASLRRDQQLLHEIDTVQPANDAIEVPAAGLLCSPPDGVTPSSALTDLRQRILATYGDDVLDRRQAGIRKAIEQLDVDDVEVAPRLQADRIPDAPTGLATRYSDMISGWLAIARLREPSVPCSAILRSGERRELELTAAERQRLQAWQGTLADQLVPLLRSRRPDWGVPLLVGMARLAALEASLQSGRLVVVDILAGEPLSLTSEAVRTHGDAVRAMRDEFRADFDAARASLVGLQEIDEIHWSRLEASAGLWLELDAAARDESAVRLPREALVPRTSTPIQPDWPRPKASAASRARAVSSLERVEAEVSAQIQALYPYDVITHNCVTEIFRTIDAAAAPEEATPLSGRISTSGTANFIPFVSAMAVDGAYPVVAREERPSYRLSGLARQQRDGDMAAALRESNTVTSTLYHLSDADEVFLFFTDDRVWPRPALGLANLAVGAGATLAGLATLPLDGGSLLEAGARGMLFSAPELVFVNIRKGPVAVLPRDWERATRS